MDIQNRIELTLSRVYLRYLLSNPVICMIWLWIVGTKSIFKNFSVQQQIIQSQQAFFGREQTFNLEEKIISPEIFCMCLNSLFTSSICCNPPQMKELTWQTRLELFLKRNNCISLVLIQNLLSKINDSF